MINGFGDKEIFIFYSFLCRYEKKINAIETSNELISNFPNLQKFDKLISDFTCKLTTREDMPIMGLLALPNTVYMTNSKRTKTLSFLKHLRNSIAHGQIMKEVNYIHITDYREDKSTKEKVYTARGKVEVPKIEAILNLIIDSVKL